MKNKYYYLLIACVLTAGIYSSGLAQNRQCTSVCFLDSIAHSPTVPVAWSPDGQHYIVNKADTAGVFQLYMGKKGDTNLRCISDTAIQNYYSFQWTPWIQKNKFQPHWHPSGKWIICAVDWDVLSANIWLLKTVSYVSWLQFEYTGVWQDIWATDTAGKNWYHLVSTNDGFTGVAFTPDGKKGAWANADTGANLNVDKFGLWTLMLSEFTDTGAGPALVNTQNINPAGARWIEPGNFSPDGKSLLISSDIGLTDAEGQDQFILNINTGAYINLTNSPKIWDEHGLFSPDGKKIVFMSSYPYRVDTNTYHTFSLKTEYMLMDAVYPDSTARNSCDSIYYPGLEQLTHFNVPGYIESDTTQGDVAAAGAWMADGKEFMGQNYSAPNLFNWNIFFTGNCGNDTATSINEQRISTASFTIFPNPANQMLYVRFAQSLCTATIHVQDITGREIMSANATTISKDKVVPIDIGNLEQGMYFVQVVTEQSTSAGKFIKQ